MKILIPRWRGTSDYLSLLDAGSIIRVAYVDDSFLRKGPND